MLSFLTLFDLQEVTIAEEALMSVFKTRAEIFDNLELGDAFWENLTPEKTFWPVSSSISAQRQRMTGGWKPRCPVVTAMAFRIQERYNKLMDLVKYELDERLTSSNDREDEREGEREDDRVHREEGRMSQEFMLTECAQACRKS